MIYIRKSKEIIRGNMSGYIDNLPTPNQTFAATQPLINRNFTVLDIAFSVDHTPLTNTTYQGEHNKVTLTTRTSPAFSPIDPVASADGPILYSKVAPNGLKEIFLETTSPGSQIVQLTDMSNPVTSASNGSTFLPGGTILKWGSFQAITATFTVTYSSLSPALTAFPSNTQNVILTPINSGGIGNYRVSSQTNTGFTVVTTAGATFFFLAIGN